MIEISELNIYPIKSLHGISLQRAELGVRGLKYDRNWMVVDSNYNFVTQRNLPKMATIRTSIIHSTLVLEHESITSLDISINQRSKNQVLTTVWNDRCSAFDEGDNVSKWLTEVLGKLNGKELRLVKFDDNFQRTVNGMYLKDEFSHTAFSDGFPFLVTSEESLNTLNNLLLQKGSPKVGMERFRANIVINGTKPLEENDFETLSDLKNNYSLGIRKPCQRCVITTIDQNNSKVIEPNEPPKTLIQMNPIPNKNNAYFGQNATLLSGDGELITVGDQLTVEYK